MVRVALRFAAIGAGIGAVTCTYVPDVGSAIGAVSDRAVTPVPVSVPVPWRLRGRLGVSVSNMHAGIGVPSGARYRCRCSRARIGRGYRCPYVCEVSVSRRFGARICRVGVCGPYVGPATRFGA